MCGKHSWGHRHLWLGRLRRFPREDDTSADLEGRSGSLPGSGKSKWHPDSPIAYNSMLMRKRVAPMGSAVIWQESSSELRVGGGCGLRKRLHEVSFSHLTSRSQVSPLGRTSGPLDRFFLFPGCKGNLRSPHFLPVLCAHILSCLCSAVPGGASPPPSSSLF